MHYAQMLVHEERMEFCELIEVRENDFAYNIFFYDETNFTS